MHIIENSFLNGEVIRFDGALRMQGTLINRKSLIREASLLALYPILWPEVIFRLAPLRPGF